MLPMSRSLSAPPVRNALRLASSSSSAANRKINKVKTSADKKKLQIDWADGSSSNLPFAWLRDADTDHKILHMNELSMEVRPESISVDQQGEQVTIQWPPYDISRYNTKWLWDHGHAAASLGAGVAPAAHSAMLWGQGFKIPEVSNDLMAEAAKLKQAFDLYGVVKIKAGHNLAEGDFTGLLGLPNAVPFSVKEKHLSKAYPMSTQLPEQEVFPRIHTIKSLSPGIGTLMVADGYHIAQKFQQSHPELFEFAASRTISYNAENDKGQVMASRPIFSLGDDGRLMTVCFNNPHRVRDVLLPHRTQELLYKSMKVFSHILMSSYVDVPMSTGDILVVDNRRVLSGNASFAPLEDSKARKPLFRLSIFGDKK